MSRLVINAKLAIPGLIVIAQSVYSETVNDNIFLQYVPATTKAFTRFNLPINAYVESIYNHDFNEDMVKALRKTVQDFTKLLRTDASVNVSLVDLYVSVSSLLNDSDKAYDNLQNNVSLLSIPEVTALFPIDVNTDLQEGSLLFLEQFEDIKAIKDSDKDLYKSILEARKNIRSVTQLYIRNYVRSKGSLVNYSELLKALHANNLVHSYPADFIGYIDEHGALYTTNKLKLAITPLNCVVVMNKSYDPKLDNTYILQAKSATAKSYTNVYSVNYKKASTQKKFQAVKDLTKSIDAVRKAWLQAITTKNLSEAAIILELIYLTQARIGSKSNATVDKASQTLKRTYGISTILGKHVKEEDQAIVIEYPGKAAFKGDIHHYQRHVVPKKEVPSVLYDFLVKASKKPNESVFNISQQKVRDFFYACGAPENVTVHKLRTLKGTSIMQERIAKHPFKNTKTTTTAVTKWLKDQALDIGIQLGHMSGEKPTSATAIAHYIDPVAMLRLYKEAKVMPTKTMLKLLHIDINSIESVDI